MKSFIGLTIRNIKVYLKDRQAVFFSLLTPLIVFCLYVLFLRGSFVSGLENSLGEAVNYVSKTDINMFANMLLLSGVIGSSVITVSYSSLTTIVSDKENKIDYDISVTPVSRPCIIISYLMAAFVCSFMVSVLLLLGSVIVVSLLGDIYLGFIDIIKLIGLTTLGSLSATALLMIMVMLFKTSSQAGAFQGLLCAAVGFIIGAYIPMSQFSSTVQTLANIFPGSHITAMYRDILLGGVLEHMDLAMNGLDNHIMVNTLKEVFSVNLKMFNETVKTDISCIYVISFFILSVVASSLMYSKLYKRK